MAKSADVSIHLMWDDRWKRWDCVVTNAASRRVVKGRIESTLPIDVHGQHLLLEAVRREVASWLF